MRDGGCPLPLQWRVTTQEAVQRRGRPRAAGLLTKWQAVNLGEAAFLARSKKEAAEVVAWEAAHRDPNIRQTSGRKVGQGARPSTVPPRAAPPAAAKKISGLKAQCGVRLKRSLRATG